MSTCATCRYFAHGDCHTDPGVPMAVREDRVACRFHALRVVRPNDWRPTVGILTRDAGAAPIGPISATVPVEATAPRSAPESPATGLPAGTAGHPQHDEPRPNGYTIDWLDLTHRTGG